MLAWRAVEGAGQPQDPEPVRQLFDRLLKTTQEVLDVERREDLQRIILLVATAAIGYGIAGGVLTDMLGMSEETVQGFPGWVAQNMG